MSGSRRWFRYQSAIGIDYSVQLDESNGRGLVYPINSPCMPNRSAAHPFLPKFIKMRYVNTIAWVQGEKLRRKFYVGDRIDFDILAVQKFVFAPISPDPLDANGGSPVWWEVTSLVGEKAKYPRWYDPFGVSVDTGLTDGTPKLENS